MDDVLWQKLPDAEELRDCYLKMKYLISFTVRRNFSLFVNGPIFLKIKKAISETKLIPLLSQNHFDRSKFKAEYPFFCAERSALHPWEFVCVFIFF